jgi:hypothetical protein
VSDGEKIPLKEKMPERKGRFVPARTRNARGRFYRILLLFIVVVSVCILGIPFLRGRLLHRTEALYTAILSAGGPVLANVDDKQLPYPEEYKRQEYSFPDAGQTLPQDWIFTVPTKEDDTSDTNDYALISPKTMETDTDISVVPASGKTSANKDSEETGTGSGIQYTDGKAESDAYALLLEKYPKVAEMVHGGDSSLQFRSWGGARVEEGVYWIRLVFERDRNPEVYIWQVTVQSRQVVPLSYNARSIQ